MVAFDSADGIRSFGTPSPSFPPLHSPSVSPVHFVLPADVVRRVSCAYLPLVHQQSSRVAQHTACLLRGMRGLFCCAHEIDFFLLDF